MRIAGFVLASSFVLFGCANAAEEKSAETSAQGSNPEMKEVMTAMIEQYSETLWNVAREDYRPKSEEDWVRLENAAIGLEQSGKLLMLSHLAKDEEDWAKFSQAMIDAAATARKTIKERNLDALIEAGNLLNDTCVECHKVYDAGQ